MQLTLRLLGNRHPSFIARTVFVKNNNVDDACRLVNRILGKEGILEQFRLTRYYENPSRREEESTMKNAKQYTMRIWRGKSNLFFARTDMSLSQDVIDVQP